MRENIRKLQYTRDYDTARRMNEPNYMQQLRWILQTQYWTNKTDTDHITYASGDFPCSPVAKTPAPHAGSPGWVPGWGTRAHILQLKIPHIATKTRHSQICPSSSARWWSHLDPRSWCPEAKVPSLGTQLTWCLRSPRKASGTDNNGAGSFFPGYRWLWARWETHPWGQPGTAAQMQ